MNFLKHERFNVFKDKYFILGFLIKFIFLFTAGGYYATSYFTPFLDYAITNLGENPWAHYPPEYFPYGSFIFMILALPKWLLFNLFGDQALGANFLSHFSLKFPLLIFDTLLFWILTRWTLYPPKRVIFFYWFNPILFYISYIYGQLDVVSISLVFLTLHFLIKRQPVTASLFFAFATLSKFHVIILTPFLMAYIWNNYFAKESLKYLLISSLIFLVVLSIGVWPVLSSSHLDYITAGSPEAFRLFSAKLAYDENIHLFVGLVVIFVALGRLILSSRITEEGLIYGCGLLLGTLLFVTNPMPGWFFWFIPFLCLFYSNYFNLPKTLLLSICTFYFIYFLGSDFSSNFLYKSIFLTVLQTHILAFLLAFYFMILSSEAPLINRIKPFFVGLTGDSGAGKNHFTDLVKDLLGESNCMVVEGDNYHKWERGDKNWENLTHLHPQANNLFQLQEHAERITKGLSIHHHHYDHNTGKFTDKTFAEPKKNVIIQGLHSFYLRALRKKLDLRIFLNPSDSVRLHWKIKRDVNERGHSLEKVLQSISKRRVDSAAHIQPQKEASDWVIEMSTENEAQEKQELDLFLKCTFFNDESLSNIFEALSKNNVQIELSNPADEKDRVVAIIKGNISASTIEKIANDCFPHLRQITRSRKRPIFHSNYDGILQILFLSLLQRRVHSDSQAL